MRGRDIEGRAAAATGLYRSVDQLQQLRSRGRAELLFIDSAVVVRVCGFELGFHYGCILLRIERGIGIGIRGLERSFVETTG